MVDNRDDKLGQIIADFLQAAEAGEAVDREALLQQHPDLADELQEFLADDSQWKRVARAADSEVSPTIDVSSHDGSEVEIAPTFDSEAPSGSPEVAAQRIGYFGDYELLEEIARGGMGVVYKARQVNLNRVVALKMILAGQLAGEQDVQRFHAEAEAAAALDHPNIVPIFEVGEHEGQHFFSMGYVAGASLADRIADGPLPPDEAAELVKTMAEAIHYAHTKGVIHRDLKPANVLLEIADARLPVADDTDQSKIKNQKSQIPKITDFGLAKKLDSDSGLTATGQILGTPAYMPPEQAAGNVSEVTETADVYSLGAILYCLLVGRPPFQAANPIQTIQQVLADEPAAPRSLNPAIPLDLETICLKCLAKAPGKRYASAQDLADELTRFRRGVPILARPVGPLERGWRWCKRKPALAGLWTMCLLVLLSLGIGGPILGLHQREIANTEKGLRKDADDARVEANRKREEADRQRQIASDEKQRAQEHLVAGQLLLGKIAREKGDIAEAITWYLQAYLDSPPESPTRLSARNLISAWGAYLEATLVHPAGVHKFAVSPDSKRILVSPLNEPEQMWDLETLEAIGKPVNYHGDTGMAQFGPDGEFILTGGWGDAAIWDPETQKKRFVLKSREAHEGSAGFGARLSPDGRTIATATTYTDITLWNAETGEQRGKTLNVGHHAYSVQFSFDSKLMFTYGVQKILRVWEVETGEAVGKPLKNVADFDIHASSQILAICSEDEGKIELLNIFDQLIVHEFDPEFQASRVAFDLPGRHLLAFGNSKVVLWQNALSDQPVRQQLTGAHAAKFSPDGEFVATSEHFGLKVWKVGSDRPRWEHHITGGFQSIEFAPDSQTLFVRNRNDNGLQLFQTAWGKPLRQEDHVRIAEYTPDGKKLIVGSDRGWARILKVSVVDPRKGETAIQFEDLHRGQFCLAANGNLAATRKDDFVQCWNAENWQPIGDPLELIGVQHIAMSPDGKVLAAIVEIEKPFGVRIQPDYRPGTYQLEFRDIATHRMIGKPVALETYNPSKPKFDVTGKTLLVGGRLVDVETRKVTEMYPEGWRDQREPKEEMLARIVGYSDLPGPAPKMWDENTGAPVTIRLPESGLKTVRLSENGKVIATQNESGMVRTWNTATGEPLGPPMSVDGRPTYVSIDGRYVVCVGDTAVTLWNVHTGQPCGAPLFDDSNNPNPAVRFFAAGTRCITYNDHGVRLWDCATAQVLGPPLDSRGTVPFSPNNEQCLVVSQSYATPWSVELWRLPQPAEDDPVRLQLSVEVRTGLRVDEKGALQRLSHQQWLDRKTRLEKLGGPCDVK